MRQVEPFMPEGMGIWYLRYVDDQAQVPDRGPFLAHKSALKAMRQVNSPDDIETVELGKGAVKLHFEPAEPEVAPEETWTAPAEPEAPEPTPKPAKAKGKAKKAPKAKAAKADPVPDPEARSETFGTSAERHAWVEDAAQFALEIVAKAGGKVHDRIRVTMGWPVGLRGGKVLGQCWSEVASADGVREIFLSPAMSDGSRIVDVLVHELCHACLPHEVKHDKEFKQLATACGLEGKMTATVASAELQGLIADWIEVRGPYPAGALDPSASGRKKQSTRLIKAECGDCGYTFRVTRKWIEAAIPHCPDPECLSHEHDTPMTIGDD